nr:protein kinase [Candidatus Melainabacteria bacterium]
VEEYKSLQHPNLIQLLDCRPLDDTPCLILEYAQGETLRKLLSRTNFIETEAQIGRTALQICSLLSHLHSKGFAHGNLTTGSIILVEANGETIVKVGGFCSIEASNGSSDDNENINQVNIKDTFERLTATTNKSTRIRSDVNAVAAIIYEMITGFNLNEEEHRDDQELVAISALRPDIAEVEFLKETLKKGLSKKDGYKSIVHFQNAIRSWMEKVNREFAAAAASGSTQFVKPRTDVLEKVSLIEARRSETYVPVSKRWKRQYQGLKFIEADLRSELNSLKANQIKSEATLSMLVSKAIAAKRQRKSPVRAIAEIAIASTCVVVTCGAVVNYFSTNLDSMKSKYLGVARALSRPAASTSVEAEPQIELLDYRQDSAYKRWSNSKEFGQARRIEANCQLRDK